MLESIYEAIRNDPEFCALAFGAINSLWFLFVYFNKKSHDKKLEALKQSHRLDIEKRKRIFEMKSSQFEKYFRLIDEFGKKQQVDIPMKMQPIINTFMDEYLTANNVGDKAAETIAIKKFSSQISDLTNEGMEQYLALKAETNSLRLIASDQLASLFDELQNSYDTAFENNRSFMSKFFELTATNNQEEIQNYRNLILSDGQRIKDNADSLMKQMRSELQEI